MGWASFTMRMGGRLTPELPGRINSQDLVNGGKEIRW
jgi:hypothetical protein